MSVEAQVVTGNANHPSVQNLKGWSFRGTSAVINLRKAAVDGDIIGTLTTNQSVVFDEPIDATGGTYVQVVSGTLDQGVLYFT